MGAILHTLVSCGVFEVGRRASRHTLVRIVEGVSRGTVIDTVSNTVVGICDIHALFNAVSCVVVSEVASWARRHAYPISNVLELIRIVAAFLQAFVGVVLTVEFRYAWTYCYTGLCGSISIVRICTR